MNLLSSPLVLGDWLEPFNLWFLLSPDVPNVPEEPTSQLVHLIEVEDRVLCCKLLIGRKQSAIKSPLPYGLSPDTILWATWLRDGRPVALACLALGRTAAVQASIDSIRSGVRPQVAFEREPREPPNVAVLHYHKRPGGGNDVTVVPMGPEGYRVTGSGSAIRKPSLFTLTFHTPQLIAAIAAPDNAIVGTITMSEFHQTFALPGYTPTTSATGMVQLEVHAAQLIRGPSFIVPTLVLNCPTQVNGIRVNRQLSVRCHFDGAELCAEVLPGSSAVRNKNCDGPVPGLEDDEGLAIVAPAASLMLKASHSRPVDQAPFTMRFERFLDR